MGRRSDPLRDKEWIPLIGERSKPFDRTNGATATVAGPATTEFDDRLFLLEKGIAGNIAAGFGGGTS